MIRHELPDTSDKPWSPVQFVPSAVARHRREFEALERFAALVTGAAHPTRRDLLNWLGENRREQVSHGDLDLLYGTEERFEPWP